MYDVWYLLPCLVSDGFLNIREIPNITSFQNSLDQLESPLFLKTMTQQSRPEAQMRETLLEVGTLYFNLDTNPLFENDLYRSDLLLLMYAGWKRSWTVSDSGSNDSFRYCSFP